MHKPFSFTGMPRLVFGPGKLAALPGITAGFGKNVLIITGGESFKRSGGLDRLLAFYSDSGSAVHNRTVTGEPSPGIVDQIAAEFRGRQIHAVAAVGGGSVMDAGKAVAAMVVTEGPVKQYLEGVGTEEHPGNTLPLVAVPTTAGTGSEATKNAVLSEPGENGYKKSLRHDNFIPHTALIDPELAVSCPSEVTAACGMDAVTQLLEAYVSSKSNALTDALAFDGLARAGRALMPACSNKSQDVGVRGEMAYAAFLSGVTLAQAGLGTVHGLAGAVGGLSEMPHGAACGTLLAPVVKATIASLSRNPQPENSGFLEKFARAGQVITGRKSDTEGGCRQLVEILYEWSEKLPLPRLGQFGIDEAMVESIVKGSSNKNNPGPLTEEEMRSVLMERL